MFSRRIAMISGPQRSANHRYGVGGDLTRKGESLSDAIPLTDAARCARVSSRSPT